MVRTTQKPSLKTGNIGLVGEWSSWSSFSDCQQRQHCPIRRRGVQVATRSCKVSSNGGKCLGPSHKYQLCPGSLNCDFSPSKYAEQVCRKVSLVNDSILPFGEITNGCQIQCFMAAPTHGLVSNDWTVPDGVRCGQGQRFCVRGSCQMFDCTGSQFRLPNCPQKWDEWSPVTKCVAESCLVTSKSLRLVRRRCNALDKQCQGPSTGLQLCPMRSESCEKLLTPSQFATARCSKHKVNHKLMFRTDLLLKNKLAKYGQFLALKAMKAALLLTFYYMALTAANFESGLIQPPSSRFTKLIHYLELAFS